MQSNDAVAKLDSVAEWVAAAINHRGEDSSFGTMRGFKSSIDPLQWEFETQGGYEAVVFCLSKDVIGKIEAFHCGETRRTRVLGRLVYPKNFTVERVAKALVDHIGYGSVEELLELGRKAECIRTESVSALE